MNEENLIGRQFGHLTVIELSNKGPRGNSWLCECDCGKRLILSTCHLTGNKSRNPNKSCGCKQKKQNGNTQKYPKIYRAWKAMLARCYKQERDNFERYGGKGIIVCEEWRSDFEPFLEWALSNGYQEDLTLDRIESTKPYEPDNCRWADYYIQEANRGLMGNNTTGYTGVSKGKNGTFRAYLQRKGTRRSLGIHKTLGQAVAAREKALELYEKTGVI